MARFRLVFVRKGLWLGGAMLLGAALAYAPVAAFTGDMITVTKMGLAGVALLAVARLLPRAAGPAESPEGPADRPANGPPPTTLQ